MTVKRLVGAGSLFVFSSNILIFITNKPNYSVSSLYLKLGGRHEGCLRVYHQVSGILLLLLLAIYIFQKHTVSLDATF
jgi:hypothetical protein